jgi:hypothetical protein
VNQSAPLFAINMARDTTYKGYFYNSGTWTATGALVCGLTSALATAETWPEDITPGLEPYAARTAGLVLIASTLSMWDTPRGSVSGPAQEWAMSDGTKIRVELAAFDSEAEAQAVCEAEAAGTELAPEPGSFSGEALGDSCWNWSSPTGSQRLLVRSGRYVASLSALSASETTDGGVLVETLARIALEEVLTQP